MIIPFAKAIYTRDGHIGLPGGKTDLIGLFNSIRAAAYPHVHQPFVVFAQLIAGLGEVPFHIDVRSAATNEVIFTSSTHRLQFERRTQMVQMAYTISRCRFPRAGVYLVQLHCQDQWIADTSIELFEPGDES